MSNSEKQQAANIVWFEIPADNPERATAFYSNLFGWKINPFPGGGEYWHIDTGGADDTPDGALKRRKHLHGKNGGAANGLLRRVPGYRGQCVRYLAERPKREIVVQKRAARSSYY